MPDGLAQRSTDPASPLYPGQGFAGKYQVGERIGSGGFADVYRAEHVGLGREVALKVLKPRWRGDAGCVRRLELEARLCAAAVHPSIVEVYDIGSEGPLLYLVLELIRGRPMDRLLKSWRAPLAVAMDWMLEILGALQAAHEAGVVHGDLKPANVIVTRDEGDVGRCLKLIDFGASSAQAMSDRQTVWGTPHYMAPELARGVAPSAASDVYAAGIVLFELITGELPFVGEDTDDVLRKHVLEPLPEVRGRLVRPLVDIARRACAKRPAERYRSAADMGRAVTAELIRQARIVARADDGTFSD